MSLMQSLQCLKRWLKRTMIVYTLEIIAHIHCFFSLSFFHCKITAPEPLHLVTGRQEHLQISFCLQAAILEDDDVVGTMQNLAAVGNDEAGAFSCGEKLIP